VEQGYGGIEAMRSSWADYAHIDDGRDNPIEAVIWGTLLFNWILALVNARIAGMSQAHVVICEILLMAASVFFIARRGLHKDQLALLCAFALYLVFTLLRFMYAQEIAPKPVRDMAIIFIFLALGLAYRCEPYKLLYRITLFVAVVAFVEVFLPNVYADFFNVKAYYINTRGFSESDFWNTDSTVFVSGTRPDERFFLPFVDWLRASSVFLEPVSLGNFIVVSLAVLLAGWQSLSIRVKSSWVLALIAILLLSDSRYGFACSLVLIAFRLFFSRFPQQFSFLIFVGVVGAAWLMIQALHVTQAADNFTGRIFYTFWSLSTLDLNALLGVRLSLVNRFADSGLTYFIVCQSLLVVAFLLVYYSIAVVGTNTRSRFIKNAVMIAFSLSLLISNSLFSIKIAALMWFCVGAFISAREPREASDMADAQLPISPIAAAR
jgi:putative polymerase